MTTNKRLDFGSDPDHDVNLEIFKGIFAIVEYAECFGISCLCAGGVLLVCFSVNCFIKINSYKISRFLPRE